jgi:hypothetical protein
MGDGGVNRSEEQKSGRAREQGSRESVALFPGPRLLSTVYTCPIPHLWCGTGAASAGCLLLVLIIAASGWWRAANLDAFGTSNDEGTHLMWARLANEGHPLYSQTRAVQGPFFIGLIQLAFRLLGTRVASGRWMEIGLGLVALLGVGLLARRFRGWTAAWAAAVTLSVAPLFFRFSRIARGDVAASAFLVLALLSGYAFRASGRRVWLGVSGLFLSANLLVKAINPLAFTLILLLILQRRLGAVQDSGDRDSLLPPFHVSELLGDGLILGLGIVLPFAFCFAVYDPAGLFDTLVTFRLDLRAASPWNPAVNAAEIGAFLGRNMALAALAVYGWLSLFYNEARLAELTYRGVVPVRNPQRGTRRVVTWWRGAAAVMGLWLAITSFTLMSHTPLFTHHLISLLLPMAVLAGVAVGDVVRRLVHWRTGGALTRAWGLIGLTLVGFYAVSLPNWLATDQHARAEVTGGRETDAIELLRTVTGPGDFVISDNQMLPFMAGRLSPPPLGDIALVAIRSGRQTTERLITLSRDYHVEAVATWSHRLPWLPDYLDWVEENYVARHKWDDHHIIYFGRRVSAGQIPNRVDAQVGDSIELLGYDLGSWESSGGDEGGAGEVQQGMGSRQRVLDVTLYWRTGTPMGEDYTVFVQLLDPDGRLVTQHDGQPLYGYLPTSDWSPDDVIPDRHRLLLPADLSPGRYRLTAGMYALETLERLPVRPAYSHRDADLPTGDNVTLASLEMGD